MNEEMRTVFGNTLVELGKKNAEILVLDGDLNTSTKSIKFKRSFPDRFIQVGIAEQNMAGIGAGLASEGFIPFITSFASFITRKACDQIAISIAYPGLNVKIPGSYPGIPTSRGGASHVAIADLAIMRALPNMRVVDPGDNQELKLVMEKAVCYNGPVYFRVTRYTLPCLFSSDYKFQWGKGVILKSGTDVTLIGTGMMTSFCMKSAELLKEKGIEAEVVHMSSLKPLDKDLIIKSASKTGVVVTAENASIIGGLGSAVAEVLAKNDIRTKFKMIGINDEYVKSGSIKKLLSYHQMRPEDITSTALSLI